MADDRLGLWVSTSYWKSNVSQITGAEIPIGIAKLIGNANVVSVVGKGDGSGALDQRSGRLIRFGQEYLSKITDQSVVLKTRRILLSRITANLVPSSVKHASSTKNSELMTSSGFSSETLRNMLLTSSLVLHKSKKSRLKIYPRTINFFQSLGYQSWKEVNTAVESAITMENIRGLAILGK